MSDATALFPLSTGVAPDFDLRGQTGSTNADLVAVAAERDDFAVVATLDQTAGRGRLDRQWSSPRGETLAASVLLRTRTDTGDALPVDAWGWYPLMAGAALRKAVGALLPDADVTLKWPNDVQIGGRKVSGLLADLVIVDGAPDSVVMGSGINLTIPADRLPTPTSTSLALEGASGSAVELADAVFAAYLRELKRLVGILGSSADGVDAIRAAVSRDCSTLGRRVRVELPDGSDVHGIAQSLDPSGRLVVLPDDSAEPLVVAAGDVTHLRYE